MLAMAGRGIVAIRGSAYTRLHQTSSLAPYTTCRAAALPPSLPPVQTAWSAVGRGHKACCNAGHKQEQGYQSDTSTLPGWQHMPQVLFCLGAA